MDQKKNSHQRKPKRQSKTLEDNFWDCSVCTFRNTAEAFKCAMCDVRKGTSTRKPRLNPQLVAQQLTATTTTPKPPKREGSKERKSQNSSSGNFEERKSKKKIRNIRPRLKNVDRSQVHRQPVTVNNVTVVITEFLPKAVTAVTNPVISMDVPSSSDVSNHSEISVNGDLAPSHQSSS